MINKFSTWLAENTSNLSTVQDMKSHRTDVVESLRDPDPIYPESSNKILDDAMKGFNFISSFLKLPDTEILHLNDQSDRPARHIQSGNYDFLKEFGLYKVPGAVKNIWESEFGKDDQDYNWMIHQNVNGLDMIIWKGSNWDEHHYFFGIADFLRWLEKTNPSKISRAFQYGDFMKIMNSSKKISPEFLHKHRGAIGGAKYNV